MAADLVVLDADPAQDVRRFAAVRCVVRGGQVIYPRQVK
jgi:imidazolonepropionase-like amidohydrolase